MRGEDTLAEWARTTGTGSPPHARGRPDPIEKEIGEFGITPACAGKTSATEGRRHAQQDHPRMRGEDRLGGRINFVDVGSPPHARGRRARNTVDYSTPRITPACAGKTSRRQRLATLCADHPRMRGEDFALKVVKELLKGSPPHARGRHVYIVAPLDDVRITPACAGKTARRFPRKCGGRDHPRMRGEDPCSIEFVRRRWGSPPHARGRPYIYSCRI